MFFFVVVQALCEKKQEIKIKKASLLYAVSTNLSKFKVLIQNPSYI